ncbi:uncharacterized protein N7446_013896 [Penicillium canescens]|uniref:Zn(2)-C6 fungal-type domain-containing protein n=1 Tax=Penicillium canescens TaxID=5083 RepID=A0AAD6N2V6_PENCN|nr:uncharacterized protein N7446_013896 [Penicillium canescens]KAJ6023531.1 hypothetical protein N7460_013926 [Penicillium canescens]KAJ6025194.1 hypothetical protein N7444_012873 [Penicillium canescens]KAJ6042830.1 hypothetical protein N7446_013896 [Penicillium canescens]
MDMTLDPLNSGSIKRIRQACANCRRKKTKCSGERPVCFHCRRNRLTCIYEPYSTTISDPPAPHLAPTASIPTDQSNAELLRRLSTIESRLAELSACAPAGNGNNLSEFSLPGNHISTSGESGARYFQSISSPIDHASFPPAPILRSVLGTYFEHVHNQPYSYFQEASFHEKLQWNVLPRCLVLAVLSSAVRFSKHDYYAGRTQEASERYARESWLSVLTEHLTAEDNLNVHVVQTVNLLAVVDYTAGRVSSGWLKIGLAARISQDLHLMDEPNQWLSYTEQEERRRAFWSAYLIDKLISCGRSRPLVILNEDCKVQLPCDEQTFWKGEWKKTNTIEQLLSWNTEVTESPSPFALVILMASIFGRCTRYVHQNRRADEIPPWDPKSEFSAINSSLLLLESYSKIGTRRVSDILQTETESVDRKEVAHLVFARALFHLCHCLLNHPFLVRLRLKAFGSKAPTSFSARSLQVGCDHARHIMDVLRDAHESGSSHFELQSATRRQSDISHYFIESLDSLRRLAKLWVHAANMAVRLQEFHNMSHQFASLLDPTCLMEDVDPASQELLWSMIDYGILGADPNQKPLTPRNTIPNLQTPSSGALGSDILENMQLQFENENRDIFTGLTPTMRLNEAEKKDMKAHSRLLTLPRDNLIIRLELTVMAGKQQSPWNGVVSGTTAVILANILVYPLDIVKMRLQVQVQRTYQQGKCAGYENHHDTTKDTHYNNAADAIFRILREDGVSGLYNGLESSIAGTASMNFAYFYWSAVARSLHQAILHSYDFSDTNSIIKELGLGAVGGALAQLCTNPIAVISTRQQTRKASEKKISMWATMKEISQSEDGWTGLWRGFKVNLILVVNPMITYGVYQWLRRGLVTLNKELGFLDAFLLGAVSKVLATIATHPLIVAKAMLQSTPPDSRRGKPFRGFTEVLAYIIKNEGPSRLYKGLAPQIIKGFLVQGLIMMLKERTEILLMLAISFFKRRSQRRSFLKGK